MFHILRHKEWQLFSQILIRIIHVADKSIYAQYLIAKRGECRRMIAVNK